MVLVDSSGRTERVRYRGLNILAFYLLDRRLDLKVDELLFKSENKLDRETGEKKTGSGTSGSDSISIGGSIGFWGLGFSIIMQSLSL